MDAKDKSTQSRFMAEVAALRERIHAVGREEVLHRTRLSNSTLSAILDGRLPWLQTGFSGKDPGPRKRTLKLWTRSLTRAAVYLDEPPFKWIEAAGLDPTDKFHSETIEGELADIARRSGRTSRREPLSGIVQEGKVNAMLFEYPPFCRDTDDRAGLFGSICRRVVESINPDFEVKMRVESDLEEILGSSEDVQLVTGVFDTVFRRFRGFDFLPLLGWRVTLNAVWIESEKQRAPRWDEIFHPARAETKNIHALVVKGEVGHLYLTGHSGAYYKKTGRDAPLRVNEILAAYDDHATALIEMRDLRPNATHVFVADDYSCRHLVHELNFKGRLGKGQHAKLVTGRPWELPSYQLSIGVPAETTETSPGSSRWFELVRQALRSEIYDTAYIQTAYSYGETIVRAIQEKGFDFADVPSGARPHYFRLSDDDELRTRHFWSVAYEPVFEALVGYDSLGSGADKALGAARLLPIGLPESELDELTAQAVRQIRNGCSVDEKEVRKAAASAGSEFETSANPNVLESLVRATNDKSRTTQATKAQT